MQMLHTTGIRCSYFKNGNKLLKEKAVAKNNKQQQQQEKKAKLTRAAHGNKDKYFGWNRQSCAYNQINVVIEWCIFRGGLCLDFM